jgi:exopolysaccharide biosynthesis protein
VAEFLAVMPLGMQTEIRLGFDPPWGEVDWAVEGGPRLVVDGEISISAREEGFRGDVAGGAASRAAVGISREGRLMLVAVESPGTGRGGVTLEHLATIMRKLGAEQAMNLDGGSSVTVVEKGQIVNRAKRGARAVSNALVVVPRQAPAQQQGASPRSDFPSPTLD